MHGAASVVGPLLVSLLLAAPIPGSAHLASGTPGEGAGPTAIPLLPGAVASPVPLLFSIASFRLVPTQLDVGMNLSAAVTVHGAVGWVRFDYAGLPPGCPNLNASAWTCAPNASGAYTITVLATASDGSSAQTAGSVRVNPPLAVPSFTASPSPALEGTLLEVHATISGGTPRFGYAYTGLPPGCISVNTGWFNCTPTQSGSYAIRVTVTDAAGGRSNASLALLVEPSPPVSPPGFWSPIVLAAVAGAAAVAAGAVVLLWRRRRPKPGTGGRPPPTPAQPAPAGSAGEAPTSRA